MGCHGVPIARVRNGQTISRIGEKLKYISERRIGTKTYNSYNLNGTMDGHLTSSQGHNCGYDPGAVVARRRTELSLLRPQIDEKLS